MKRNLLFLMLVFLMCPEKYKLFNEKDLADPIRHFQRVNYQLFVIWQSLPAKLAKYLTVYPTTNENLSPRAFAMSIKVESCMSVCPCSSAEMYSRFLPMRSPNCCWVSF